MCNLLTVADNQVLHVLLDGFYNILKTFPDEKVIYQIEVSSGAFLLILLILVINDPRSW